MMDFGSELQPKPKLKIKRKYKKLISITALVIILAALGIAFYIKTNNKNPLPSDIKSRVAYKAVYPSSKTGSLGQGGYQYQAEQKSLTYSVNYKGTNVVFVEQPAPESLGSKGQIYFPAIGIHPYAQFQSKLGPVALTKFWQSSNLKPIGQTGVLVAQGTLAVAHPDKELTNAQWKDLFDSLKISK